MPAGTPLQPSGSLVIKQAGTVVKNLAVSGTIEVEANNVTVENTLVAVGGGGSGFMNGDGNSDIQIDSGVTGTQLIDDSLTNAADGTTVQDAVYNDGGSSNTAEGLYVYSQSDPNVTTVDTCSSSGEKNIPGGGVTGSWWGPGVIKDSYLTGNIYFACQHVDVIYEPAGSLLDVEHDTLLNPHSQTSDILVDASTGGSADLVVNQSLLAGGGYSIYGDAHGTSGTNTITNDMFARCLTSNQEQSGGVHVCSGGADSSGYFPSGGAFGPDDDMASSTTWSGNVWDNNGATVSR